MRPKVLHLTNDFLGSTVYRDLYDKLKDGSFEHVVYCPIRHETIEASSGFINRNIGYGVVYSDVLKRKHRFLFQQKIEYLYNDITRKIDFDSIRVIHASTLFSDGALAYQIYQRFNIPYIVTVRNTDLNIYLKYMLHLRSLGTAILRNASKIIFITPAYLNRFNQLPYLKKLLPAFRKKTTVIPNGLHDFWIENVVDSKQENLPGPTVELLYVGNFSRSKNLGAVIKAIEKLNSRRNIYRLSIVGGGKGNLESLISEKDFIHYYGKISDKVQLQSIFRSVNIFIMPSKRETFGLVYIEALSQGIPIIYTKNEGVYGMYDSNIGEAVDPNDIRGIQEAIVKIAENYSHYDFNPKLIVGQHNWEVIARLYESIYDELTHNK